MKRLLSVIILVCFLAGCMESSLNSVETPKSFLFIADGITDQILEELSPYEDTVTVSVATIKSGTEAYLSGDSLENNAWTRAYLNYLNIDLDYLWVEDEDDYSAKLSLSIMTDTLPDMFLVDQNNFDLLKKKDLLADLSNVYSQELSMLAKSCFEGYDLPFQFAEENGILYGIPQLQGNESTDCPIIFIRNDWLQKLGVGAPQTQQELIDVLITFAGRGLDGGIDTYGIGIKKQLWGGQFSLEGFFNAYGAYPNIWIKDSEGNLVYGSIQPQMKEALRDLQNLYEAGAIDPEFMIKDADMVAENVANQQIGMAYGDDHFVTSVTAPAFRNAKEKIPDQWICLPAVSNTKGYPTLQSSALTPKYFLVVKKDYEHPEALIKMINLWCQLMFSDGITKNTYYRYHSTTSTLPYEYSFTNGLWPLHDESLKNMYLLAKGEICKKDFTGFSIYELGNIIKFKEGGYSHIRYYEQYWRKSADDIRTAGSVQLLYEKEYPICHTQFYGTGTQTMSQMMPTLKQYQDDTIIKIITGEKPVEYFDEFVAEWQRLGGEKITREVNELQDSLPAGS